MRGEVLTPASGPQLPGLCVQQSLVYLFGAVVKICITFNQYNRDAGVKQMKIANFMTMPQAPLMSLIAHDFTDIDMLTPTGTSVTKTCYPSNADHTASLIKGLRGEAWSRINGSANMQDFLSRPVQGGRERQHNLLFL